MKRPASLALASHLKILLVLVSHGLKTLATLVLSDLLATCLFQVSHSGLPLF